MRSRNPSSGKRIGLGLLVVSVGWLIASGFHRNDGGSPVKSPPSAGRLKRDLQLLIVGDSDDESNCPPDSSPGFSPRLASGDPASTDDRTAAIPELERRSFAAERTKNDAARLP
ncbi:MAG: hypothetical protein FJ295_11615 [Planctomycetes bacterium]|nr:hypothetical protein [Planctomycetota bacterium]